jgi:serine/threonine-protein kinase
MMIEVGTMLNNRYEILEKIGEGGSAMVYKAKCHILNRFVAVKVLKDEFSSDAEFVEKFKKEAYAAASFSDNNIVNIYDIGTEGNVNYIIQEFIDGKTLKQIINENGRLEYKDAVSKCRQIASALTCAHRNNIIHRDIKPHNILVTKEGVLKVADFGIAKATDSVTITSTDKVMGSAHYISPEQAKGIYVDARTDIYSLGIVLYEMLTGKVPFDGETPVAVALKHIQEPPVPPRNLNPDVPMALNNIVLKAIAKEPYKRFQTAKEFIEGLDDFSNNLNVEKKSVQDEFTRIMDPIDETTLFRENEINDINNAVKPKNAEVDDLESDDEADKASKEPRSKKNSLSKQKKTIIAVILAIIVVGAIGVIAYTSALGNSPSSTSKTTVAVPNIVGMQQADAKKLIESKGLKFTVAETKNSDKAKGSVIESFPSAGSNVASGSEVRVNISAGPDQPTVPPLEGMNLDSAKQAIQTAGFKVGTVTPQSSDSVQNGYVISQDPPDGSAADKDSVINLTVSTGPKINMSKVPDVFNKDKDAAAAAISAAGLNPSISYIQTQDNTLNNKVQYQDPQAGSNIKQGSVVTITVYQYVDNTVAVPSVVGKTQSDAQSALSQAQVSMSVGGTKPTNDSTQDGKVASQDKTGKQQKGTTVTVTIYKYVPQDNSTTNNTTPQTPPTTPQK